MSGIGRLNRVLERVDRMLGMNDKDLMRTIREGRDGPAAISGPEQPVVRGLDYELDLLYTEIRENPNENRNWYVQTPADHWRFHECVGKNSKGIEFQFVISFLSGLIGTVSFHGFNVQIEGCSYLYSRKLGGEMQPVEYTSFFNFTRDVIEFLDSIFYKE